MNLKAHQANGAETKDDKKSGKKKHKKKNEADGKQKVDIKSVGQAEGRGQECGQEEQECGQAEGRGQECGQEEQECGQAEG